MSFISFNKESRDLSENELTGTIPPTIGNLKKLELLFVYFVRILLISFSNFIKGEFLKMN